MYSNFSYFCHNIDIPDNTGPECEPYACDNIENQASESGIWHWPLYVQDSSIVPEPFDKQDNPPADQPDLYVGAPNSGSGWATKFGQLSKTALPDTGYGTCSTGVQVPYHIKYSGYSLHSYTTVPPLEEYNEDGSAPTPNTMFAMSGAGIVHDVSTYQVDGFYVCRGGGTALYTATNGTGGGSSMDCYLYYQKEPDGLGGEQYAAYIEIGPGNGPVVGTAGDHVLDPTVTRDTFGWKEWTGPADYFNGGVPRNVGFAVVPVSTEQVKNTTQNESRTAWSRYDTYDIYVTRGDTTTKYTKRFFLGNTYSSLNRDDPLQEADKIRFQADTAGYNLFNSIQGKIHSISVGNPQTLTSEQWEDMMAAYNTNYTDYTPPGYCSV